MNINSEDLRQFLLPSKNSSYHKAIIRLLLKLKTKKLLRRKLRRRKYSPPKIGVVPQIKVMQEFLLNLMCMVKATRALS